jgi:hypothetical protein
VVQTLAPGAYTVVATGNGNDMPGIGLVEAYDLSPAGNSKLANISTRGSVGTGDDVLIAGFIVGDVANTTVVLRALGPSLASAVSEVLSDPSLTVYDGNGVVLATNDNWQNDPNMLEISQGGLGPTERRRGCHPIACSARAYSVIVSGADGGSGINLVELFDLDWVGHLDYPVDLRLVRLPFDQGNPRPILS